MSDDDVELRKWLGRDPKLSLEPNKGSLSLQVASTSPVSPHTLSQGQR